MMKEWMQDLFDLMANKHIELHLAGEMGEVDASLKVESRRGEMAEVATVIGAEDWEAALEELIQEAMRRRKGCGVTE